MTKTVVLFFFFPFSVFLILDCASYSNTTRHSGYGGSVLVDSVTVGFLRYEYVEKSSSSAWDVSEYSQGRLDFVLYSVPEKKILSSKNLYKDYTGFITCQPIYYANSWLLYRDIDGKTNLLNLKTDERVVFDWKTKPGGISLNGKYAMFVLKDTFYVYDVEKRTTVKTDQEKVFYVDTSGQFCLAALREQNPMYLKFKWIGKIALPSMTIDTLLVLPDTLRYAFVVTDDGKSLILSNYAILSMPIPYFCSLQKIFEGEISIDSIKTKYGFEPECNINSSTGSYTFSRAEKTYIGNLYTDDADTVF